MQELQQVLGETKVNGVICVAGGWAGGNAASERTSLGVAGRSSQPDVSHADLIRNTDLMFKQSVWTSVISTSIAAHHMKP